MNANEFHPLLADYGRGPQLRSCRITVNDLVPYLRHADYTDEQMKEVWPRVTLEELAALKAYIAANFDEVMAENDRVDAWIARDMAAQQTREFSDRTWWTRERRKDFCEWLKSGNNSPDRTLSEIMVAYRLRREIVRSVGAA